MKEKIKENKMNQNDATNSMYSQLVLLMIWTIGSKMKENFGDTMK